MSATNVSTHVDLTFVFSNDDAAYRQAFCISPMNGVCPFGPCPNPDVTGLGQQISIYLTTMSYGFILCYIPSLKRPMLYAHLSVLYSLLISGTISIAKHELTKADSIFVLVCVSSPVSIYLWASTIRSFWNVDAFPIEHRNKKKTAAQSLEVQTTRLITLGSLAYTIAYLLVTFVPSDVIQFAQPACDRDYGINLWFNLAWMLPVALQTAYIAAFYYFARISVKWWTLRCSYTTPPPVFDTVRVQSAGEPLDELAANIRQIDIITWTKMVLDAQFPKLNRTSITCILSVLQLSILPTFEILWFDSKDLIPLLVLFYVVWRHHGPQHDSEFGSANPNVAARMSLSGFARRVGISVFLAGYFTLRTMGFPVVPTISDGLIVFIACTAAVWCRRVYSGSSMHKFLPTFLVVFGLVTAIFATFEFVTIPNSAALDATSRPIGEQHTVIELPPASLNVLGTVTWIVSWLATSIWPLKRDVTWNLLKTLFFRRAHIFKCSCVILAPHILWIQATSLASPTRSNEMPFGQIFALIVAIMTLFTLLDEAKDVRADVWWAFIKSDCMPLDNEEQSMGHRSLPQTSELNRATTPANNAGPPVIPI